MKNKDKFTLIIFISLIVLIIGLFLFNIYKDRKLDNVDRKIQYIFDDLTKDIIFEKGSNLFLNAINLLNRNDVLIIEKDKKNLVKYYAINGYAHYKKILNFTIVSNTFKDSEVLKYMELKKIVKYENNYYIENYKERINNNYVGSIIKIDSYDKKHINFKSTNYYCENYNYIGLLENVPNCNFTSNETEFTIIYENNKLRLNDLEEIKNILK